MSDFKLSAQLVGHDADVRAVSFPSPGVVLSASRDRTVRIWRRSSGTPPVFEPSIASRGADFVNALAYLPASPDYPAGLIASGGKDTIIEVRKPDSDPGSNAERLLIGHAHNVCTLDVSPSGSFIVSGGWDGQARIWKVGSWETELILGGHDGKSVWAVLALDEQTVATGCADSTIRLFDLRNHTAGEASPRSTIHTPDVVRALCKVPPNHPSGAALASATNDGVIRLWKLNGQQVGELHGHESFIYSLASLPSGELVSSGEDRTVRVWRGLECIQTITHPAISVWGVAACTENGDIVSGASDGVARVFTRSNTRVADEETLRLFDESIKASSIPQQQMGDINKEKLPGPEFLKARSGTKEGQVQMIREENGSITAHTWSMTQQQWVNVGTVVDSAASTGRKVEYNGQQYDYVFDVDIKDGEPPLKLPYNLSENPYDRATKFINDNELSINYLDTVANFIVENTQGARLGANSSGPKDSFGSENRYRPGDAEAGASSTPKILPQTQYLTITAAKYEAITNKILNINANMISSGRKDVALNPAEQAKLRGVRSSLESSRPISEAGLGIVVLIVAGWPYTDRLAGLDLLRCAATSPLAATFSHPDFGSIVQLAIDRSLGAEDGQSPNENLVMMALRTAANIFNTTGGRELAAQESERVIAFVERIIGIDGEPPIGEFNRNVLIALTTVLIDYAVLSQSALSNRLSGTLPSKITTVLGKVLQTQSDPEVIYRALVALGTLISASAREPKKLGAATWVTAAIGKVPEARVKTVGDECLALLR